MHHDNDNQPRIRFLSVCSGIEAASCAWPTWEAVAFAEIEKFPSAVLAHHYPDVRNLGDFTKIDTRTLGRVDVLCGGTPCQAFSVAGLRQGLDDARGNLTLKFVELAHELAGYGKTDGNGLRNVVWENVVGVLSDKGNAFGCFLAGLVGADAPIVPPGRWTNAGMVSGPRGRAAWRVLDAQYFGVAQRRRRVIVVADFGNGADPAAVLLIEQGLPRHPPSRGEAGKDVAGTVDASAARSRGAGTNPGMIAEAVDVAPIAWSIMPQNSGKDYKARQVDVAQPVMAGGPVGGNQGGDYIQHRVTYTVDVAPTLRAGGNKTGGDRPPGTDVDTADSLIAVHAIQAGALRTNPNSGPDGVGVQEGIAYTLEARAEVQAVCVTGDIAHTLKAEGADASEDGTGRGTPIVCVHADAIGRTGDAITPSLDAAGVARIRNPGIGIIDDGTSYNLMANGQPHAVSVALRGCEGGATAELGGEVATALRASTGGGDKPHVLAFDLVQITSKTNRSRAEDGLPAPTMSKASNLHVATSSAVRRLTPTECERLQGFPDSYTAIPWRGKPASECPDGPRYKALGNSWAVPKFVWLGQRIERFMPAVAVPANDNHQSLPNDRKVSHA